MTTPNHLILGKDQTARVVGVEPGTGDKCVLFVQNEAGAISQLEVPLSHWIIYTEKLSPKMQELAGNQPYKWLMEYDNKAKYDEVLRASRERRMDVFQVRDAKEAFMVKSGVTMYKGLKVQDVSILSFDLEHTYGIGDKLAKNGKLLLISNTFRDSKGNITKRLFSFDEYASEGAMLGAWVEWLRAKDPSIIAGHNLFGHDFKILRHASVKTGVQLRIGRDWKELKFERQKSFYRKDASQSYEYFNAHAYGREIVDTFFLAIKYDVKRVFDSYGLKQIIRQMGLEKTDRVHYDASQIIANHTNPTEWAKIKAYAIDDADDALAVFDKMAPAFFYTACNIPRSFQSIINTASGSQINSILVRSYLQEGQSIARACEKIKFRGAYVFGVPGLHWNTFKIDIRSQYPSIMLEYRIEDKKKDPASNCLKIVEHFYNARIELKKKAKSDPFYKALDDAAKIFLNSIYGFKGAGRLNYNHPTGAEEVCRRGRGLISQSIEWATGVPFRTEDYNLKPEEEEFEDHDAA